MNKNKSQKLEKVSMALVAKKPNKPRNKKNRTNKVTIAKINPTNMFRSQANGFLQKYVNTVCDPWEHGPLKLGYDCMVDTVLATGYFRSSMTVNATDGSFALVGLPSSASCVLTYNSGLASATNTPLGCTNFNAINQQFATARVVSGGLRAFALFPETSSPGVLWAGIIPAIQYSSLNTLTTSSFNSLPGAEIGIGTKGARSCFLPVDNSSFQFSSLTIGSYITNSGVTMPSAIPFIMGQGFPVGTVIWYEFIINLEGLENSSNTLTVGINPEAPSDVAANYFATPERLFSAAKAIMGSTTVMDGVQNLAGHFNPNVGRAIGSVRSAFAGGRNLRNSIMASGRDAARIGAQNSVIIEEMKEEYQLVPRRR